MSPARKKPKAGSARPGGRLSAPNPLLNGLAIRFTNEDKDYIFLSFLNAIQDPSTVNDRVRNIPLLLERILPDTETTRRRMARLLQGLEILSHALRVLLTIDDLDLVSELKGAISDSIREAFPLDEPAPRDASTIFAKALAQRLEGLQSRLQRARNPAIQSALNVFAHMEQLLDPKLPFPRLVLADTIDFTAFEPEVRTRQATKRRRKGS